MTVLPGASPLAHGDVGGQTRVPPRCGPARRRRSERVGAQPTFKSAHRRAYQWSTRREGSAARLSEEIPAESYGRPALSGTPVATIWRTRRSLPRFACQASRNTESCCVEEQLNHPVGVACDAPVDATLLLSRLTRKSRQAPTRSPTRRSGAWEADSRRECN